MQKCKFFFTCVTFLFLTLTAANVFAEGRYSLMGFAQNIGEDFMYIGTSPARIEKESALWTLGIIGTGAFIYTQDEKIRDFVQGHQKSSSMDGLSNIAEKFGNGAYELPFLALYGGSGYLIKNDRMMDTSILSYESFLVTGVIGTVVKYGAGRPRPFKDRGSETFTAFNTSDTDTSFPSGHSFSAFSIASVFADEYDDNPMVGVTSYGLASMVAMQRIYADVHWASDVFAGAVLGTVIGKSVVYLHKYKKMENAYIIPVSVPSEGYSGITAVVRF